MNKDKITKEEIELGVKVFRLRTYIERSNILMKQLLEYPYDLLEHDQNVFDVTNSEDIKEFNRLMNKLYECRNGSKNSMVMN